ncbi:MAG: type II secretion system GspH family protein [Clostridiales bacterium]|jgi:type II secretory pathway pseudopilin PulG|nr:type II secretion system GspH family protein [Clostridiales bacterium]
MKTHKGLTLVEIIIAFVILSVMAGMFIPGVISQYALMQNAKAITENVFSSANRAERKAQDIKDTLAGTPAPTPLPAPNTYTMFPGTADQRTVSYYPVEESISDIDGNPSSKSIYSVVADVRQPEFAVPVTTSLETRIEVGGVVVDGSYVESATRITTDYTMDHPELLLINKYQWYVSGPGFPMRWDNVDMSDPGVGINVPMFPNHFSIIPYATGSQLVITPEMAGRHVVCVMTPAAITGKMGLSIISKPLYIYGLPVFDNLAAHYDASLVDLPPGDTVVYTWPDISGNGSDTAHYGTHSSGVLSITDFPILTGREYPIKAREIGFDGSGWMEAPGLILNGSDDFTMFAVVKADNVTDSEIVSNGAAWSFDMSVYPGLLDDEWYILGINSDTKRTVGKDASISSDDPLGDGASSDVVRIADNGSTVHLAELIIYDTLLLDSEWEEVTQYLGNKYNID